MSGPLPKTYRLEALLISIVIIVALVLFLRAQWSHH